MGQKQLGPSLNVELPHAGHDALCLARTMQKGPAPHPARTSAVGAHHRTIAPRRAKATAPSTHPISPCPCSMPMHAFCASGHTYRHLHQHLTATRTANQPQVEPRQAEFQQDLRDVIAKV
jgi:hypothetical protein